MTVTAMIIPEEEALRWALDQDSVNTLADHLAQTSRMTASETVALVIGMVRSGLVTIYITKGVAFAPEDLTVSLLAREPYVWMEPTPTTLPRLSDVRDAAAGSTSDRSRAVRAG